MLPVLRLASAQNDRANARYHRHFDNKVYLAATIHGNSDRANLLIDEAMAICGSPYHAIHQDEHWNEAELAFLQMFEEEATQDQLRNNIGLTPTQRVAITYLKARGLTRIAVDAQEHWMGRQKYEVAYATQLMGDITEDDLDIISSANACI